MASKEKKTNILDIKYIYFFGGILICLLSIILIINVGYFARVLAFVPFFLFGVSSCALYFAVYLIGLYTLLKDKVFRFTTKLLVPGFIFAFLGLLILSSYHVYNPYIDQPFTLTFGSSNLDEGIWNFSDKYVSIIQSIQGGYFESPFLHNFNNSVFGGGYVGFMLVGLINDYANGLNDLIGGVLIAVGVLMIGLPYLFRYLKKRKNADPSAKQVKKEKPAVSKPVIEVSKPVVQPTPTVVRQTSPITSEPIIETPTPNPEPIVITTHSLYEDDFSMTGSFVPAHFSFSTRTSEVGAMNPAGSGVVRPVYKESETYKPKVEVVEVTGEEAILQQVEEETRAEQLTLDFDEPVRATPQEQRLATVQPTFVEPVATRDTTYPNPTINPTPTPEPVKKPRIKFIPPDSSLLNEYETSDAIEQNSSTAETRTIVINDTLAQFKIGAEITGYTIGPAVTRFHVSYKPGVAVKSISNVLGNLCVDLGGVDVRFEPMVAGERYSGLEVPNAVITTVGFKEVFDQLLEETKDPLSIPFGKNISGKTLYGSIRDFPHMLISGTTGSGKSVFVHTIILTLIMRNSPDDLKLVLVDPKQVEMSQYADMPHLLCPIVCDPSESKVLFDKLANDMDERYTKLRSLNVKNIKDYNRKAEELGIEKMNTIVAIVDEYADLVDQCREIVPSVTRLSAKARACGIHLIICTQRPSTNVVTGVLKSNLPTHIALKASNSTDSVTILNEGGAEKLLGKGDMLVQSTVFAGQGLVRIQSPFARDDEIERVVEYLKENYQPDYDPRFLDLIDHSKETARNAVLSGTYGVKISDDEIASDDPDEYLYPTVKEWVMTLDYVSASKIKSEFATGYPRSARIFRRLQEEGIVEDNNNPTSSKGCRVLVHDHGYGETYIENPALDESQYDPDEV